ncbi:hypothetical protein A11A3_09480 [Alcanivorax hongdengensis A-11-3]|uniref:Lipoprotein n=1 Tax=Alcanivorax hongdengensis A-11-3 TaxID=1177179 RepID=L0WEI0_9GAMM|nr:hypothetical protein [Alcanivorax hongdengensis]EKF74220.1 hypothetical protein A11A3_09480 [Alcanivorax hongdengensis A-11-3]
MRSFYHACALIVFALLATACSRTPDAADAQKALQAELKHAHLQQLLEVKDVKKDNGYQAGDGLYTLEVSYTLKAKQGLGEYTDQVKGDESLSGLDRFAMVMTLGALRMEHGDFEKGDTFNRQRSITFHDTEKGWMPMKADK